MPDLPHRAARGRSWRDNPWWIPPFLGSAPDVDRHLLTVLGLVSLALFFEQYDISMLTAALKYIAADLHIAEADLGASLSLIRLGALPAFLVVPFADRFGRRRIFLYSMLGISVLTFLTAFSQTVLQFVILQMGVRTCMVACSAVAVVIVTEEFPARHRGWGVGMLGALAACGAGFGAALFAAVNVLPFGWRALYTVGAVPLLLLPRFRREVQETRRFRDHIAVHPVAPPGWRSWVDPLLGFGSTYPLRALAIAVASGFAAGGSISVFQFTGYFTLHTLGWSPGHYSAMVIVGGGFGIIGNVVAGRASDRFGRRIVGFAFLAAFPLFAWAFYHGPTWLAPAAFTGIVFCATAGQVAIRAMSTELFPTSQRGTAAGWVTLVDTLGGAAGLGVLGAATQRGVGIPEATSLLALTSLLAGGALFLLPETNSRELELISAEDEG